MKSPEKPSTGESPSSTDSGSWQLKFIILVIAIGVFGLIGKALGLF